MLCPVEEFPLIAGYIIQYCSLGLFHTGGGGAKSSHFVFLFIFVSWYLPESLSFSILHNLHLRNNFWYAYPIQLLYLDGYDKH